MTEQEIRDGAKNFFTKHPIGKELKQRWDNRLQQYKDKLVYESDPDALKVLQAKIQYHREVVAQELGE